jgi:putative ABC transport system substrate-binding protein
MLVLVTVMALLLSGCGGMAPAKVYHVGILAGSNAFAAATDGFKAKMTALGYKEGANITYDVQQPNNDKDKQKAALDKFVADKADLIFAFPVGAVVAAKAATAGTNIPVLFGITTIEGTDLVKSVREPGGNITGIRQPGADTVVKRMEILLEIAPNVKRIAIVYDPSYPSSVKYLDTIQPAAASDKMELVLTPISTADTAAASLQKLVKDGVVGADAMISLPAEVTNVPATWKVIADFAAQYKLPLVGGPPSQVEQGALFTYTTDYYEVGTLAAPLADKIFKGTAPGTIPVVTPENRLQLNLKVAQALGLTFPEGLLNQASKLIK